MACLRARGQLTELPPTEDPLTEREIDVLRLVAQGLTNQEIAELSQRVTSENVTYQSFST